MKASGASATSFLKAPDEAIWCALIFCEDEGVANDAASALYDVWAEGHPAERLTLTEDDISRDPAHFFDTLEARSLLGDRRILTVRLSSEKLSKHFVSAIEAADDIPGLYETRLIFIAGNLKKTSKLRKTAETARNAIAVQLFPDTEEDTVTWVKAALEEHAIAIAPPALSVFIGGLPSDRRLIRSEVDKLALYGIGLNRPLETDDIVQVSATGADAAIDAMVSRALRGDAGGALSELERLEAAGASPISLLRAIQRETERLLAAHAQGVSDPNSAMRLRPPVWRDQWPAFRDALKSWTPAMLMRLLARIHECEADAKRAGAMAGASTRHLITDIVRLGASAASR